LSSVAGGVTFICKFNVIFVIFVLHFHIGASGCQNHAHFLDAILNGAANNVHKDAMLKYDVENSF